MNHLTAISFVCILLSMSPANAAEKEKMVALFNGRDLAGWTYHLADPKARMEDTWTVKDGVLRCTGKPTGYLVTKKNDYENYVLTLEWRWPEKGGNNGVLVHVTKPGALGVWPKCLEVQLQDQEAGDFWVIGTTLEIENPAERIEGRRHKNLTDGSEKALGQWNTMEITCRGDEIAVKVNGKLVNRATKLSQHRGAIAFQSEGTPCEYRKVQLRLLEK